MSVATRSVEWTPERRHLKVPEALDQAATRPVEWNPERRHLKVLEALDQAKTRYYHLSAILIAGMGFFTDAYDLFCIGLVTKLLGRLYYPDNSPSGPGQMPIGWNAAVTGTALLGTLTGQIFFGWLGDKLGRKRAYGITLTIMIIFSLASGLSPGKDPKAVMTTLCFFRFWLGFGIGGDYPLSATIMSEYANTKTRGAFIAAVFAMQGLGILTGGFVGLILALIFNKAFPAPEFQTNPAKSTPLQADFLWRIMFMLGAIPAAATFYYRMRMPETARYTALVAKDTRKAVLDMTKVLNVPESDLAETTVNINVGGAGSKRNLEYNLFSREFLRRHGLHLLGTSTTWFLLDIAFYSQNLFQNRIFSFIGWLPPPGTMSGIEEVYRSSKAQCIVACCATLPGYWVSMFLVDRIGRIVIQVQGFIFMAAFMFAIAIRFNTLDDGDRRNITTFMVLFSFTFFFANFGPNTTTFIIPAELFPARFRATCHGISAGSGKLGAIVGSFGFLFASQSQDEKIAAPYPAGIGLKKTLFIMAGANIIGAALTFLIPETKGRSLEDLSGESDFGPEFTKVSSQTGPSTSTSFEPQGHS